MSSLARPLHRLILLLLLFTGAALGAPAANADDSSVGTKAKEATHAVGEAARKVGQEAKHAGKEIGAGAAKVGHKVADTAKSAGKGIAKGAQRAGAAVKKATHKDTPEAKPEAGGSK